MERFDIYIRRFGPGREPAAERLSRVFGVPVERARELVASLPRVVKRGVPEEQLERYVDTLGEIGAVYDLRPTPIAPTQVIAVGTASAAEAEARVEDGATLMLPPPREEAGSAPRFSGTVLLLPVEPAPLPAAPAPWAEPSASLGTADTLRERAEVLVEGTASGPGSVHSTWIEGRSSVAPARGPNDTLVESRPAGSMVNPSTSAPEPLAPPAPVLPPQAAVPALAPVPFGAELEQRAPDSRLMHVHAPTVRSFQTLAEATAPVVAPVAPEPFRAHDPWALAPAPASVVQPLYSRPQDRTPPQGSPVVPASALAPQPSSLAPVARASEPPASSTPPSSLAPPLSLAPLAAAPAPAPAASAPLSEVWRAIEPVSAAELGPRRPRSSRPPPPASDELGPASEMQLFGREEYVALTAAARADFERSAKRSGERDQELAVAPPGMREGRPVRGAQRPPAGAAPLPLPPGSLQAALQAPARPSARPPVARLTAPEPELPGWLRWTLRVGIGVSLFVIVGALRQCRALDDGVEKALARWEVRPSVSPDLGADTRTPGVAPTPHAALGPVAREWLRSDLNQFSNGDKDRVRGLVQRFEDAGALGVYVGTISQSGMVKIGGELLVVLPSDPTRRAAVVAVHEGFLRATFGAFAPHSDPKADVLRVTL